ncbi:MAG TPA: hypothetical protein VEO54_02050 [Thermoanaerobaculia bacterium]|nr:hypothetical protein [Thermoanaerobaculia bacterium]
MRRTALLALAVVLGACTREEASVQPQPPRAPERPAVAVPRAPVVTDRQRYAMQEGPFGPETTIVSTYTAPADRDVYLLNCNGAFAVGLQRPAGEQWEHVWLPGMNACMSAPIVIRAGESHQATIVADSGVDAAVSSRQTETKIGTGTYRVVWHGLLGSYEPDKSPPGAHLPIEQRVSAPIFIEAAPPPDPSRPSPATPPAEVWSVEPAHGTHVAADARVRVQLAPVFGEPHLYVDRDPVEYARRGDTLEFTPRRRWTPGRHSVRVVYQNEQRKTLWYAWSFTVGGAAE